MRNIELKARLDAPDRAPEICGRLGAARQGAIRQTDTYFPVAHGRLKLRENQPGNTELIHYHRDNASGAKGSDYRIVLASPEMGKLLADALGVLVTVRKVRALWLWHNVRIHLDTVEGLGSFLEFEAVLGGMHDDADGHAKLRTLSDAFGIEQSDLIAVSYSDLLLGGQGLGGTATCQDILFSS